MTMRPLVVSALLLGGACLAPPASAASEATTHRSGSPPGTPIPEEWSWQNPFLSPNPWNNIHNDAWFTDSYTVAGPARARRVQVEVISQLTFDDPDTGTPITVRLGECAAHAYDAQGNLLTVCAGFPDPVAKVFKRSIVALSPDDEILAYRAFDAPFEDLRAALLDFGGAGYFYLDDEEQMVVGMPDGHVVVWERQASAVSDVDSWSSSRDVNVAGEGGAVPPDLGSLYALVPNEDGYIWFTTSGGVVGTIAPESCVADCVKWLDVNDPDGDGVRTPQSDGGFQTISESHSVDRKSTFQQTDYNMFRFDIDAAGTPVIAWQEPYDRGSQIKPGQTSQGSGTSPAFFQLGGRDFVTIMDNAATPHINVYRAETVLGPGESRLFAQAAPFGNDTQVSDENSLIVYPGSRPGTMRIYGENNWGNVRLVSTAGPLVTRPGFGGIEVGAAGRVQVLPANRRIRVPSVVSKGNIPSHALYTYNKRASGWYLTALDPDRPSRVLWTVQVGSGAIKYNNWYAQLSLGPDGKTFAVGALTGLIKVRTVPGRPLPKACYSILEPADFVDTMAALAEYQDGPIFHDEYLEAAFRGWEDDFPRLYRLGKSTTVQVRDLIDDLVDAEEILARVDHDASLLDDHARSLLATIAGSHDPLLETASDFYDDNCTTR